LDAVGLAFQARFGLVEGAPIDITDAANRGTLGSLAVMWSCA
jgi:hypothetical protein